MKKIVLFLFFAFAFNPLFSQIGIKAGLNFSNLNNQDVESLSGYQVGLFLHFKLSKIVHFNTGFNYSQKGFIIPKSHFGTPLEGEEIRLNYIEIPANFAFHLKIGQQLSLFAQAGPYLAISISGDASEAIDYGLNFGLGLEYMQFQIAFNYGLGLNQTFSTYKNRVYSVTVAGYFQSKNP